MQVIRWSCGVKMKPRPGSDEIEEMRAACPKGTLVLYSATTQYDYRIEHDNVFQLMKAIKILAEQDKQLTVVG